MKKAQSIEDLKKEGLVKMANEIENSFASDIFMKTMEKMDEIDNSQLIWLKDFLKRHKKRFEDFSIEVEEMYSEKPNKAAMKPKQGKEVIVQDFTKENSIGKPYNPMNNPLFLKKIKPNESK